MENTILNKQEFENFEKRGFFVKKNYLLKDYIKHLLLLPIYISWASIGLLILFCLIYPIMLNIFPENISNLAKYITTTTLIWIFIYPIILYVKSYISAWVTFFIWNSKIEHWLFGNTWENLMKNNNLWLLERYLYKISIFFSKSNSWNILDSLKTKFMVYIFVPFIVLIFLPISLFGWRNDEVLHFILNLIILYFITTTSIILMMNFIRIIFQSINPLYAFGNIWEKIQFLTPRIEEQSKKIQSEFQSDMNYSVLSDGFDLLSATFSEIIALVIKLEKVEARANKWNLFDSEKYINSLRSDIITPLTSLKAFLEKQKTEVLKSQKELTRVRVWGSEWSENIELQSKRSESLVQELTENIEKLDVMIGKMGK